MCSDRFVAPLGVPYVNECISKILDTFFYFVHIHSRMYVFEDDFEAFFASKRKFGYGISNFKVLHDIDICN